jgi:hypothetical protein
MWFKKVCLSRFSRRARTNRTPAFTRANIWNATQFIGCYAWAQDVPIPTTALLTWPLETGIIRRGTQCRQLVEMLRLLLADDAVASFCSFDTLNAVASFCIRDVLHPMAAFSTSVNLRKALQLKPTLGTTPC